MGELYQGCLKNQDLNEGLEELRKVRKELPKKGKGKDKEESEIE